MLHFGKRKNIDDIELFITSTKATVTFVALLPSQVIKKIS